MGIIKSVCTAAGSAFVVFLCLRMVEVKSCETESGEVKDIKCTKQEPLKKDTSLMFDVRRVLQTALMKGTVYLCSECHSDR